MLRISAIKVKEEEKKKSSVSAYAPQVCGVSLPLPPKKLIGNMDREFIAQRQRGLQAYLDAVTQHPLLCAALPVKKFLDPNNYSANYTGGFLAIFPFPFIFSEEIYREPRLSLDADAQCEIPYAGSRNSHQCCGNCKC